MMAVPLEAESLIAKYQLGALKRVYKPNTAASIIVGLFLLAFAALWITFAFSITGSSLAVANQEASFAGSQSTTPFTILSVVFPLFGLIFVAVGLGVIISALLNRHVRAFLCEYGVAHVGRNGADAFRWEQVATVLDKVNVHTSTTNQPNGFTSTSTTSSHSYTVVCKDGRRFGFDRILSGAEQLGGEIQIAVALCKKTV